LAHENKIKMIMKKKYSALNERKKLNGAINLKNDKGIK